jgi:hypothetical protein
MLAAAAVSPSSSARSMREAGTGMGGTATICDAIELRESPKKQASLWVTASQAVEKVVSFVILSEAKNLSGF